MKSLIARIIYGGGQKLRGYELCCLEDLMSHLEQGERDILVKQIEAISLVQRFSRDKLVVLHMSAEIGSVHCPLFVSMSPE
jgi:hypothetical protein